MQSFQLIEDQGHVYIDFYFTNSYGKQEIRYTLHSVKLLPYETLVTGRFTNMVTNVLPYRIFCESWNATLYLNWIEKNTKHNWSIDLRSDHLGHLVGLWQFSDIKDALLFKLTFA